jgi:site-specific DNA-adenine methylase
MNKPFATYNGGKESDGTFQKIINEIPPHDIYIEAFLGNGAVFRKKKAAQYSILIDIDTAVIEAWGKTCLPTAANLINTDAVRWLENFTVPAAILATAGLRTMIYLDPPYPKEVRKNRKNLYRHETSENMHTRLLEVATRLPATIAISSYPNPMYDEMLEGWRSITFQNQTRNGPAIEKLWMNYPEPGQLHDYRYLGDNYRERELIKGRLHRTATKIKQMPPREKAVLLEMLR